jgi:flagellar basal-body rod protein FlgG
MDRGTYIAASGGLIQMRKLELVNNNLANINTVGFKRQVLINDEQSFDQTFAKEFEKVDPYARGDHRRSPGAANTRAVTDFSLGPIKDTGNPLDAALRNPNDFFVINTPEGQEYTRAGNFTLNQQGTLVTADGYAVVGDGGEINADAPGAIIETSGAVRAGGVEVARLQVVRIENTGSLERAGESRFKLRGGGNPPQQVEPDVVPGALEMANVSAISSVIDLITANRAFEMYSKSTQTIDTLNQMSIGQLGRSR